MIRFHHQPRHLKAYLWLRWMPLAYLRGVYWYICMSNLFDEGGDSLHVCIGTSIGLVQAEQMNWIYSLEEVMREIKDE